MKYLHIISLPILAVVFSCAKENGTSAEPKMPESANSETVQATIREDEENVKTTYTINEDTMVATFYWKGSESFARVIRHFDSSKNDDDYYDYYYADIFTSSGDLASTRPFTCSSPLEGDYQDMKIAFYPYFSQNANGANVGYPIGTSKTFTYNLQETIAFNSDNPLDGVVPMAGYYVQEDGEYDFKPLTGILAVRMTGIPATATKLTISSESYKMSGSTATITSLTSKTKESTILTGLKTFSYDKGLCQSLMASGANKSKTYTFSNLDPSVEYTFYFPLPISANHNNDGITTLDDLTIKMYEGSRTIYSNTANKSLTVKRGYITRLPKITYSEDKVTAKIIGPSTDPVLKIWSGGKVVRSRAYISTSSEFVKDNCNLEFTTNPVTYQLKNWTTGTYKLDGSGKYYLHYMALSEDVPASAITSLDGDERVVDYDTIEFYYLNNTDSGNIIGQYVNDYMVGTVNYPAVGANGDNTITLAVSDDANKGNIMITEFAGYCYDVSQSTHKTLVSDFSNFTDGSPVYGVYGNETISGNPAAKFELVDQNVFYKDAAGYSHYITPTDRDYIRLAFNSDGYSSGISHDLVVWEPNICNCYYSRSYVDLQFTSFVAHKASTFANLIPLTKSMVTTNTSFGEDGSGDSGGSAALVDQRYNTHWHSNYYGSTDLDEYGIYIQIDLGSSKTLQNFKVRFRTRNVNHGLPTKYFIAASNSEDFSGDVYKTDVTSISGDASKLYQHIVNADASYRYIRICITEMNHTNGGSDAMSLVNVPEGGQRYTHMAEVQLWEN